MLQTRKERPGEMDTGWARASKRQSQGSTPRQLGAASGPPWVATYLQPSGCSAAQKQNLKIKEVSVDPERRGL